MFDGGDEGEHTSVGCVEISRIFVTHYPFVMKQQHLTEVSGVVSRSYSATWHGKPADLCFVVLSDKSQASIKLVHSP